MPDPILPATHEELVAALTELESDFAAIVQRLRDLAARAAHTPNATAWLVMLKTAAGRTGVVHDFALRLVHDAEDFRFSPPGE
jgi:hypothetical protein